MSASTLLQQTNSFKSFSGSVDTEGSGELEVPGIAEFLDGKSVFVTGAAGFVGSVLLETLLRCCPGIKNIYILLRAKRGLSPDARKEQITKKKIFSKLRMTNQEIFKKIVVVEGDVTHEDLGIASDVMFDLEENVSVVFHCAAIVNFGKPLRYIIIQNVIGTENVVKFCRRLNNLTAFVHTSTAYSQSNKFDVDENIPSLQVPAVDLMKAAKLNDEETLTRLAKQCQPPWPNTYTFSKAIAENYLANEASDLPTAIVRPSIVVSAWKGILPGYAEEGGGVTDVGVGIGKGFIRVLQCDEDKIIDIIPVDVVVNTLLTAAWYTGTVKSDDMLIVNCTSGRMSPTTWGYFITKLYHMQELYPLPKMYQKPFLVMRKYRVTYWASAIVNHYAPALCIDAILLLMRKKPKLTKLYMYYDLCLSYLLVFLTNEWRFSCDNYKMLIDSQCSKDRGVFPISLKGYSMNEMTKNLKTGAPFYEWEMDKRKFTERIPIAYKRYVVTTTIKWIFIILFLAFVAFISKTAFSNSMF